MRVGNVFCVGRNYKLHASELGNDVPTGPMIFMKPTHAVVPMNGNVVALPASFGSIHYEAEVAVRIGRRYEKGIRAERMVDAFALGIDFTLRDVQNELKQKQHPWLKAKGFKSSAPLTAFQPLDSLETLYSQHFSLTINGKEKQRGNLKDALFDLQTLVDEIGTHYGLDEGDLLFTGTPAGVGAVRDGDRMALLWGGRPLGECTVRLD